MAKPEPDIFQQVDEIDPGFDARRMAEAEADIAAGRTVPNDEVIKWLETWGKADEEPAPDAWFR